VLAGLGGADRPLGMQTVGQWNVDRIDLGIGEQRFIAAERTRDILLAGEDVGGVLAAARDRRHFHLLRGRERRAELLCDIGRAEHADAQTRR
jgi:hypothetical protein